jgi:hypothetical protein
VVVVVGAGGAVVVGGTVTTGSGARVGTVTAGAVVLAAGLVAAGLVVGELASAELVVTELVAAGADAPDPLEDAAPGLELPGFPGSCAVVARVDGEVEDAAEPDGTGASADMAD